MYSKYFLIANYGLDKKKVMVYNTNMYAVKYSSEIGA